MLKTFLATLLGVLAALGIAALVYSMHEDRKAKDDREVRVAQCQERLTRRYCELANAIPCPHPPTFEATCRANPEAMY